MIKKMCGDWLRYNNRGRDNNIWLGKILLMDERSTLQKSSCEGIRVVWWIGNIGLITGV